MVEQPGATCPGSPGGATAGLGQVRHRLGCGVDLVAGGGGGRGVAEEGWAVAPRPRGNGGIFNNGVSPPGGGGGGKNQKK